MTLFDKGIDIKKQSANQANRILLSIRNIEDRRLLRQFLPDELSVQVSTNEIAEPTFGLCILDEQSFRTNRQSLHRIKQKVAPTFLPILLLSKNKDQARSSSAILELADDVVYMPISKKLLWSRIKILLKHREYSLELKAKNQLLAHKNEQLRIFEQAVNSTNAGVLITDALHDDMPITFCNKGFKDLTGYQEDEVIGRNCRFLQNDDRNQPAIDKLRSLVANKGKGQVRLRNYRKDGTMFWNDLSIAPIKDEKGEVTHFVGIQRDVSELVETQEELRKEKEKYRLIAENSTDMISRHAPDGTYLYVSQSCKQLTGYSPEELVGQNAYESIHPEDRKQILQEEEYQFAFKNIVRRAFRKKTKSGDYKWVEASMKPIRDNVSGEIKEVQATTRDISARKEYERKLEEEKEFIDKAIKSLPELFFMIDENQNFIKWNNIDRELGYTDKEVEQMQPLDFYNKSDHKFIISKIEETLESGSAEAEVNMKAKSGELVPYYITAKKFSRKNTKFIIGSCLNLTAVKDAQYKLEQQRQLFHAIINQTESIIYVKDADKKYQLVNDSYLEVFDLDRAEVIGKTDKEVHGNEFADKAEKQDEAVLRTRDTFEVEEKISVGNHYRYYHTVKYPLEGVPGLENCICGISTDITEQHNVLHDLQERIKEQRCLYNISSLPEHNNTVEEILREAVTLLPDGWQFPEITEAALIFNDEVYKTDGYYESDWVLCTESHRIENKPLKVCVAYTEAREALDDGPFLAEERRLIDSIADTLSSQIDRIFAQRKLKQSEQRWERLVNNDPDLIQLSTADGEIRFINPAGAEMYGIDDPQKLVGKNFFDLLNISESNIAIIKVRMKKALNGETIPPRVYKMGTLDGTERYVEIQSVSITLGNGEKGLQQVAQDITNRKKHEEQLKKTILEKETLLQEVHHRVKNNLAVVSGMLQLQGFQTENEEIKQVLRDSEKRIKTMALIHEKLYQSDSLSHIDFGEYVDDLVKGLKEISKEQDSVSLNLTYDSFNLNVNQAVPCALIINEAVSNSYEHAFKEGDSGIISVSLREKGNKVYVDIMDNGQGLAEDFERRKDQSLGFTIIETLIKQLDADHSISSEDGFRFMFHFKKQEIKGSVSTLL